jgi:hypothetical protein
MLQRKSLQDASKIFQDLDSKDPRRKAEEEKIIFFPYYWNYSFITNFLPIFAAAFIITQQTDQAINYFLLLIIGVTVLLKISQLRYYKTITIDLKNKEITIQPNALFRLFLKKKIVLFKDVKKINFKSTSFWPEFRRYLIIAILTDSQELKLISAKKRETAVEVTNKLILII